MPPTIITAPLAVARARWGFSIERPTAKCGALRRDGMAVLSGQRVAARFADGTTADAADFILRILLRQGDTTLQAVESAGLPVPLHPDDAANSERVSLAAEREAMGREETILRYRGEIDELIRPLFEAVPHPPIEIIDPLAAASMARMT